MLQENVTTFGNKRYQYTGKERDAETNNEYGACPSGRARYYACPFGNSEIGRWGSVDPLGEKYFGVSPYSYCLNNALRLFDRDGKKILIYTGRTDADGNQIFVEYANGNLYNMDGSDYTEHDSFVLEAQKSLNFLLGMNDEVISEIIRGVVSSEKIHILAMSPNATDTGPLKSSEKDYYEGKSVSTLTRLMTLKYTNIKGDPEYALSTLIHELTHAYDLYFHPDAKLANMPSSARNESEIHAVAMENRFYMRMAMNILVTTYKNEKINSPKNDSIAR
jgi:RHS repeat-associated protein